jgi:subtilisin family serine protease
VSWSASDTGGSQLVRTEIWQADKACETAQSADFRKVDEVSASPEAGARPRAGLANGSYCFGVHAVDGAGNCLTEHGTSCGGGALMSKGNPVHVIRDVPMAQDFSLTAAPPAQNSAPGQTAVFDVTVRSTGGFASAVSFSTPSPAGAPTRTIPGTPSGQANTLPGQPGSTSPASRRATMTPFGMGIRGDLNHDSIIDISDLALLLMHWRCSQCPPEVNLDNDGTVDTFDFAILLANWGKKGSEGGGKLAGMPGAPSAPTSMLVRFNPDPPAPATLVALEQMGVRVSRTVALNGTIYVMTVPTGRSVQDVSYAVAAVPGVARAQPNYARILVAAPNDPRYQEQWDLQLIGMEQAWNVTRGEGVIVAVVDTGVARGPDFQGTEFVPGFDVYDNDSDPTDEHGHGTHVAGTIAQTTNNSYGVAGIAYKARLMPIKVFGKFGETDTATVIAGVKWAVDHGAKVINLSLGGPGTSQEEIEAMEYAFSRGVVVVAAAGNESSDLPFYPAAIEPYVISVSAGTPDQSRASFSNYGDTVDIMAPGVYITQEVPYWDDDDNLAGFTFQSWQGTSMAAPHVAGVATLLVSQGVTDPAAVRQRLEAALDPISYPGTEEGRYAGKGFLNAAAALQGGPPVSGTSCPPQATCTFTPPACTPLPNQTCAVKLNVATTAATPPGTYQITVAGTASLSGNTLTRTTPVTLTVQPTTAPGLTLTLTPPSQLVDPGKSASYTLKADPPAGSSGTVTFSITGLPTGATPRLNPSSCTLPCTSTLTISTLSTLTPRTYTFTVTAQSGTAMDAKTGTLIVKQPPGLGPYVGVWADPSYLEQGQTALIKWVATDVTSCSGESSPPDPTWIGAGRSCVNGCDESDEVSPRQTTTYTVTCTGTRGSDMGMATLTVGPAAGPDTEGPVIDQFDVEYGLDTITQATDMPPTITWNVHDIGSGVYGVEVERDGVTVVPFTTARQSSPMGVDDTSVPSTPATHVYTLRAYDNARPTRNVSTQSQQLTINLGGSTNRGISMTASPSRIALVKNGASVAVNLTVTSVNGFTGTVFLDFDCYNTENTYRCAFTSDLGTTASCTLETAGSTCTHTLSVQAYNPTIESTGYDFTIPLTARGAATTGMPPVNAEAPLSVKVCAQGTPASACR